MRHLLILAAVLAMLSCKGETRTSGDTLTPPKEPRIVLEGAPGRAPESFPPELPEFTNARERMVEDQIVARGISDERVLEAMRRVPRHLFIPADRRHVAYEDHPVPIGDQQTISQPFIVALMSEKLGVKPGDRVLEVGTGSGYQAAILSELVADVVSIEIIESLAESASATLGGLGYSNVTVIHGDGYEGWEARAPYDAIIVTAAVERVPLPLAEQLKPGGRIVIPVGRSGWNQLLLVVEKDAEGNLKPERVEEVRFVPLTRELR